MKILTTTLLLLFVQFSFSQDYFEGAVTYDYSYQSLYKFITTDYIAKTFPISEVKSFKGSKLAIETIFNDKSANTKTLYDLDNQVGYIIKASSDSIRQFKFDEIRGKLLRNAKSSLTKEVLGKTCPAVELEYIVDQYRGKKMTCVYHYDSELKLDPALYENFKYDYRNLYVAKAGAIDVASSISIEKLYRVDGVATKIDRKEIPDSFFELPEDKVLAPLK